MQADSVMKILNTKQVKELEKVIEKNYGAIIGIENFIVIQTTEEKIWLASKEISDMDFGKLNVNSVGMYFGKLKRNEKIHLSIEGSQLIGGKCRKNIVKLDRIMGENFLKGENIRPEITDGCESHNFVLIKSGNDFIGSGLFTENGIENLTPKSRRLPL
jgi:NOL1/NOP2/fmu family ribosome biogenesis protein